MSLTVDDSKLYTPEYRNHILDLLTAEFLKDKRIAGAVLVGSGSFGFKDRYSDIDLAVLVGDEGRLDEVYSDWWGKVHAAFPVIDAFKEKPRRLYGFLLERFLELDMSFQGRSGLYEKDPQWRVLFDKRGNIPSLMKPRPKPTEDQAAAHDKRMQDSWYHVLHCVNSMQRGQPLRASFFLSWLRDEAILMAGLNRGLRTGTRSYFEDTDQLPEDVKARICGCFQKNMKPTELLRALKAVVGVYYDEAGQLDARFGGNRATRLGAAMRDYLSAFG